MRTAHTLMWSLVMMAVAFVLSYLGLAFRGAATGVSPMWPLGGVLVVVFAMVPAPMLRLTALAALVGVLAAQFDLRGFTTAAVVLSLLHVTTPWAVQRLVARLTEGRLADALESGSTVLVFVGATAVVTALNAAVGATVLWATSDAGFLQAGLTMWLAAWAGIVTIAPLGLRPRRAGDELAGRGESAAVLLVMTSLVGVMFGLDARHASALLHYPFLVFPLLMWAALRGRWWASAGALAVLNIVGTIGTVQGLGPFARADLSSAAQVLVFLVFLAAAAASTLFVRATAVERAHATGREVAERSRYASILHAATEFSVIATDLEGTITEFNEGSERMLGYCATDVVGLATPAILHSPHEVAARAGELGIEPGFDVFAKSARAGLAEARQWTYIRRDGTTLQVSLTVTAIVGPDGQQSGFIGIAQDISERLLAEQGLERSEAQHRLVVQHLPDAIISLFDAELKCQMIEGAALTRLGHSTTDYVGRTLSEVVPPQDFVLLEPAYLAALGGTEQRVEYSSSTTGRIYETEIVPVADPAGTVSHVMSVSRDVTDKRAVTAALHAAEERSRTAFEAAPIGMALVDLEGRPTRVNDAFCAVTGYEREQLLGTTISTITHPDDLGEYRGRQTQLLATDAVASAQECRLIHSGGHPVNVSMHCTLVRDDDGDASHFLIQVLDITERKHFEQQLQYLADHDPLTGLSNRRRFEADLERHVAQCAPYGNEGALIMLDIDHFKQVNDTLGHQAGDQLIISVAGILRGRLRDTDHVARLGGDEFAILLPKATRSDAEAIAKALLDKVRNEAVELSGHQRRAITTSVGIALFGSQENESANDMMVAADLAMYDAKHAGRDTYAFYSTDEYAQPPTF